MAEPVITVENLELGFQTEDGLLSVLSDVSFSVERGEVFALVGESGCGKSVTCLALARLHPEPPARYLGGRIVVDGRNVLDLGAADLRQLRGATVSYVFQEPSVSLSPVLRVGAQIAEALRLHGVPRAAAGERVRELLTQVGIPDAERLSRAYPCELSGGMQQRIMIAMAVSCSPAVLVADEPTTALDVTVQAQILDLLLDLRRRSGMTVVLVTHNLGVVAEVADTVAVMYAGQVVEQASARELLAAPAHPYTRALLDAVPKPGTRLRRLGTIPGTVPAAGEIGDGCRFAPRCAKAGPECVATSPETVNLAPGHVVRCHMAQPVE